MSERSAEQERQGHLDEGTIHAWLDGALSAADARAAESHVAGCARCAAAVAEARGLIAAASRILLALDDVPGGVLPSTVPVAPPTAADAAAVETTASHDVALSGAPAAAPTAVTSLDAARRRRRFRVTPLRAAAAIVIAAVGTTVVAREASREGTASSDRAIYTTAARRETTPTVAAVPAIAPSVGPTAPAAAPPSSPAGFAGPRRADESVAPSPQRVAAKTTPSAATETAAAGGGGAATIDVATAGNAAAKAVTSELHSEVARAETPPAPRALSAMRQAPSPAVPSRAVTVAGVAVAGVVRDVQGNALPGVVVTLGKLDAGAVTDSAGRYTIVDVPPGSYVAQARRIGYASAASTVAVAPPIAGRDTTLGPVFTLRPSALALNEAVVTGAATAPPARARRKTDAVGDATHDVARAAAAAQGSAASLAAAGCYDLSAVPRTLDLPARIVLDTAAAPGEGAGAHTVRAPAGEPPLDYDRAFWRAAGSGSDSVIVWLRDDDGAGVVLRARVDAAGLRGEAAPIAIVGAANARVVAPRCGR